LIRHLTAQYGDEVLWMNGDNPDTRNTLYEITTVKWKRLLANKKILVLDEAQRIENVGMALNVCSLHF
jgi:hypothetical protein